MNSTRLDGNIYINTTLFALIGDIPGRIIVGITLKYFGRRFNLFYMQGMVGCLCLILAFTPKQNNDIILGDIFECFEVKETAAKL